MEVGLGTGEISEYGVTASIRILKKITIRLGTGFYATRVILKNIGCLKKMNLNNITATVLVKNESYFIKSVLAPLKKYLFEVIVFDTGSEDDTAKIAEDMGCIVVRKGVSTPKQLCHYRTEMGGMTATDWVFICDGDELYTDWTFEKIAKTDMPDGKQLGFTLMVSVDYKDGEFWTLNDPFSRTAIYPRDTTFSGDYPFEIPSLFGDSSKYFYFDVPTGYHLHRLVRSPYDEKVYLRNKKRFLFSMQEHPNMKFVETVQLPLVKHNPYTRGEI